MAAATREPRQWFQDNRSRTHPLEDTMNITRRIGASALCLAAAVTVVTAAPAAAKGTDAVRTSGSCSAGSHWTLKAKPDDGRIEVEFEVDTNRNGRDWSWKMSDNGIRIGSGHQRTSAPSGFFEVEKRSANRAGPDRFIASARTATGETCRGSVTL